MITVFSEHHLLRSACTELYGGELVRPHESPERAQIVLERVQAQRLGQVIAPASFGMAPVLRVHDAEYVEFLRHAWSEWVAAGNRGEAIPDCWPARRMAQRRPNCIAGKLGLLRHGGRDLHQPGHLGGGQRRRRCRADRSLENQGWRARSVCTVPAARPSRRA